MTETRSIVVGVDDSESAQKALGWALEEARLRHAPVTVIHAWDRYTVFASNPVAYQHVGVDELQAEAERVLTEAVRPWREKYPDLTIETQLSEESPKVALIDASRHADLLVVGCRGHGGFAGMLLGSVSSAVAHHAHCPVAVVRKDR